MSVWTDARVEFIKANWKEGLSASQIARALTAADPSQPVSRNSVISKIHRLGAANGQRMPAPHRSNLPKSRKAAPTARAMIEAPPPSAAQPPVTLADGKFATVVTIGTGMCRWPIGDPAMADFHFCGHPQKSGFPYCEAHHGVAYDKKTKPPYLREQKRVA